MVTVRFRTSGVHAGERVGTRATDERGGSAGIAATPTTQGALKPPGGRTEFADSV
jgi:hypothetical protein